MGNEQIVNKRPTGIPSSVAILKSTLSIPCGSRCNWRCLACTATRAQSLNLTLRVLVLPDVNF